jgi:hypothetical protein
MGGSGNEKQGNEKQYLQTISPVGHGKRGTLFTDNDPAMASLHETAEFQALMRQVEAL